MSYERIEIDFFDALNQYENDPFVELHLWPGDNYVGHILIVIKGNPDTPYKDGKFIFEIKMFENYPFFPPGVFCHTKIWHPNIDIDKPSPTDAFWKDNVCFDIIDPDRIGKVDPETKAAGWSPTHDLILIIECLKLMVHCYPPFFNPDDPLNIEAGEEYKKSPEQFMKHALKWTKLYGMVVETCDDERKGYIEKDVIIMDDEEAEEEVIVVEDDEERIEFEIDD